ncbi:MAG: hypothetical protein R3B06_06820 [Kofleriaceae bacterium]
MSASRVRLRESYFDASDAALAVWLRLLVDEIDAAEAAPAWLADAREDWHDAATMGFGFGVMPELDDFILDEDRRAVVLALCEAAAARLRALADPVPAATLNALGTGGADAQFQWDVPRAMFQDVADQFTALVRDAALEPAS